MSKFSKRKHLVGQVLGQEIDSLTDKQSIVKIVRSKGNNLHEVESPSGETYLMSMPTKFRNVAYVKVGDFVLVEAIDEGDKVRAQMVNIILSDQIPDYINRGIWPERFKEAAKKDKSSYSHTDKENLANSDSEDELSRNVNRQPVSESEESNDDDEDGDSQSDSGAEK